MADGHQGVRLIVARSSAGPRRMVRAAGVEIITGAPVTGDLFLEGLRQGKWDAVFLAAGAQGSKKTDVQGLNLEGISWGLDFLRAVRQGRQKEVRGRVVVIGGGNVAVAVAMTALRLGADTVEVACLEKREEIAGIRIRNQGGRGGGNRHPSWLGTSGDTG